MQNDTYSLPPLELLETEREVVRLSSVLLAPSMQSDESPLTLALGRYEDGRYMPLSLASERHVLIGGTTASGRKSYISTVLTSILMRATPTDLKLLLIDPLMVSLTPFEGIPHLLTPIITQPRRAVISLLWLESEMERRYEDMRTFRVRHIDAYNSKVEKPWRRHPYIVVVITELADLMMTAPSDVENSLRRLTQQARAAGIHLILSTQRPSVDVVTGLIKSNIPCRLSFAASSLMDSRVILDQTGAEKLTGSGDGLILLNGADKPVRFQAAHVTEEEIEAVVTATKEQAEPEYIDGMTHEPPKPIDPVVDEEIAHLFLQAVELVVMSQFGSTSMLQRRLGVNFAQAGRLMELMESRKIVGPSEGSKARPVLVSADSLPALLDALNRGL